MYVSNDNKLSCVLDVAISEETMLMSPVLQQRSIATHSTSNGKMFLGVLLLFETPFLSCCLFFHSFCFILEPFFLLFFFSFAHVTEAMEGLYESLFLPFLELLKLFCLENYG